MPSISQTMSVCVSFVTMIHWKEEHHQTTPQSFHTCKGFWKIWVRKHCIIFFIQNLRFSEVCKSFSQKTTLITLSLSSKSPGDVTSAMRSIVKCSNQTIMFENFCWLLSTPTVSISLVPLCSSSSTPTEPPLQGFWAIQDIPLQQLIPCKRVTSLLPWYETTSIIEWQDKKIPKFLFGWLATAVIQSNQDFMTDQCDTDHPPCALLCSSYLCSYWVKDHINQHSHSLCKLLSQQTENHNSKHWLDNVAFPNACWCKDKFSSHFF